MNSESGKVGVSQAAEKPFETVILSGAKNLALRILKDLQSEILRSAQDDKRRAYFRNPFSLAEIGLTDLAVPW